MNATKKRGITAILIATCVVIALLAGTTGVLAKNVPVTDTEAPAEAGTSIESNPITVISTAESSDIPAELIPEPADVSEEPVTPAEPADPEPIIEQEATPVNENVPEIETIPEPTACSYCCSSDHSATYCATMAIEQRGAVGRWRIPSVGVDVALFDPGNTLGAVNQAIVDAADSASYYLLAASEPPLCYNDTFIIADHKHQGFNAIKSCTVGTEAYLDNGYTVQKYICTDIDIGSNSYYEPWGDGVLMFSNGVPIAIVDPGGIVCYTCNENSRSITIVCFQPTY